MAERNIYPIPRYIAHRGLHDILGTVPENSLPAFSEAIKHGFAIELDVRFTKDKKMVVFHDKNLMRMCNANIDLNRLTYEELKKLRLCRRDVHIPLLSEVLRLVRGRVFLLIELKNCPEVPDAEKRLVHMLRQYKGEYAVQSFDPASLMRLRLIAPEIMRGQLVSLTGKGSERFFKEIAASMPVWQMVSRPDFLSWDLKTVSIDSAFSASRLNAKLVTWTANNEDLLKTAETFSDSVIFQWIPLDHFKDI